MIFQIGLKQKWQSKMKTLVIYYSKTGNTKYMAEKIADEAKADIFEIQREKDIKSKGFMLYFRGGFESMTKRVPKLKQSDISIDDYDLIFIGTPVWAWNLNPATRAFLKSAKIKNKKIGLFCCCAGSCDSIIEEMKKHLEGNEILGDVKFIEPLKNDTESYVQKAKTWTKNIIDKASS